MSDKYEIRFGTDGWRAPIGEGFTFANVARLAHGYARYLSESGQDGAQIVVGHDGRFRARDFAACAANVLKEAGFNPLMCDRTITTPMLSAAVLQHRAAGGLMATASHNPYQYCGIKLKGANGGSLESEYVARVEQITNDADADAADDPGGRVDYSTEGISLADMHAPYFERLRAFVGAEKRSAVKLAVDPLWGAAAGVMADWFRGLGAEVTEIHGEARPDFGGLQPEPKPETLQDLCEAVRNQNCDLGVATDGDGDRVDGCCDRGKYLGAQRIFALILDLLAGRGGKGLVVKTNAASLMIDKLCDLHGLELVTTPVGFKHVAKYMYRGGVLMGGEESGGIGVLEHLPERDGILCATLLFDMAAERGKPISQVLDDLFEQVGPHHYGRRDLVLTEETKQRMLEDSLAGNLPAGVSKAEVDRLDTLDGAKYFFTDGSWIMLRASGTEPIVRIYCEAPSTPTVDSMLTAACDWARSL